jgi:hypothetical protein
MCTRTGRPPERLRKQTGQGRCNIQNPEHVRFGGVGLGHSTDEAGEQRSESFRGVGGGKDQDQGKATTAQHIFEPRVGTCVFSEPSHYAPKARRGQTLQRVTPEVGAVCGNSARTDLCGGRSAMTVPTASVQNLRGGQKAEFRHGVTGLICRLRTSSMNEAPGGHYGVVLQSTSMLEID